MVMVPLRAVPVFAVAEKVTLPFPVPDVALVIEIHDAFAEAVHAQPLPAVTLMVPGPPLAATVGHVAEREDVQGAPASTTVTVSAAIASAPAGPAARCPPAVT